MTKRQQPSTSRAARRRAVREGGKPPAAPLPPTNSAQPAEDARNAIRIETYVRVLEERVGALTQTNLALEAQLVEARGQRDELALQVAQQGVQEKVGATAKAKATPKTKAAPEA